MGLFSLSFYLARSDPRHRAHRIANDTRRGRWPGPVWFVVQWVLALNWRWRHARRETDAIVKRYGPAVEADEGISQADQARITLDLSRRYCILPISVYDFRLYRNPDAALDYIFPVEVLGVHKWQNGTTSGSDHDALQDKWIFQDRAKAAGLSTVPLLKLLKKGSTVDPADVAALSESGVFVKRRSGSQGIGSFMLHGGGEGRSGEMLSGVPITSHDNASLALGALLAKDDVLVQPLLSNHPALGAAVPSPHVVAILRIVTRRTAEGAELLSSRVRLPTNAQDRTGPTKRLRVIARIRPDSGALERNPNSFLSLLPETRLLEDSVFRDLGPHPRMPFWDEIHRQSLIAQREFSSLWSIGWDWVVTPTGPALLEGNIYWDMKRDQECEGGFVWTLLDDAS